MSDPGKLVEEARAFILGEGGKYFTTYTDETDDVALLLAAFVAAKTESLTTERDAALSQLAEAREALKPFAVYYEVNDCAEQLADDALEVPVGDLRKAAEVYGPLSPHEPKGEKA